MRVITILLVAFLAVSTGAAFAQPLTVFAAASLKGALDEVIEAADLDATVSYASSGTLARQISFGAPADIFISANPEWMNWLDQKGGIKADTRRDVLANALVLITASEDHQDVSLTTTLGWNDGMIAMGLTEAVPAGIYGKQALVSLGVWDEVKPRVAQADNVRLALALVSRKEAGYGIVYKTDAKADAKVHVIAEFPAQTHDPIAYPAAQTAGSAHPDSLPFLQLLATPEIGAIFRRHGFGLIDGNTEP